MKTQTIVKLANPNLYSDTDPVCNLCSRISNGADDMFYVFLKQKNSFKIRKTFYCVECIDNYFEKTISILEFVNPKLIDNVKSDLVFLWNEYSTQKCFAFEVLNGKPNS